MKFSGSLTKRHANRGVFITTSTFTKDALVFVEAMPQKIVLVDGKQRSYNKVSVETQAGSARAQPMLRDSPVGSATR